MTDIRQASLERRYRIVQAYGNAVSSSLVNAREVGLVAYVPVQRTHDAKIVRCSRILRKIENMLNG